MLIDWAWALEDEHTYVELKMIPWKSITSLKIKKSFSGETRLIKDWTALKLLIITYTYLQVSQIFFAIDIMGRICQLFDSSKLKVWEQIFDYLVNKE